MAKQLKCWRKAKNTQSQISFHNIKQKDYNAGQPKHLRVGEGSRFFSKDVVTITKGFALGDLEKMKNPLWTTDTYGKGRIGTFKTKTQAIKFAKSYMKKHDKC